MSGKLAADYPKQKLLFFVAQDLDDTVRENVRSFVVRLGLLRHWLNGAPRFISSREDAAELSVGDTATETVGGFIELYSAYSSWTLPREIDKQHFEDVSALVDSLQEFSRQFDLALELELDGKFVGSIVTGETDRSLSDGLLGEWRRQLGL